MEKKILLGFILFFVANLLFSNDKKTGNRNSRVADLNTFYGDSIEIKAANSRVIIYSDGNIRILKEGTSNGFTIDAGTQTLSLRGMNVNIESANGINIRGKNVTNISGSILKLNGGSTPVAKTGSIISVNGNTGTVVGNVSTTVFTQ